MGVRGNLGGHAVAHMERQWDSCVIIQKVLLEHVFFLGLLPNGSPLVLALAAALRLSRTSFFRLAVVCFLVVALHGTARLSCRSGLARAHLAQRGIAQLWNGILALETVS